MRSFDTPIIPGSLLTIEITDGYLLRIYEPTTNNMKHRLIGKTVECRDFPGETFTVESYNPETGYMKIINEAPSTDGGWTATRTVHISACKVVKEQEVLTNKHKSWT